MIDLRSLRPLDRRTLSRSVEHIHRALVIDEGWRAVGLSAEVAAAITEECFFTLGAPVGRLTSAEVPIPYPKHLEEAAVPQVQNIVDAAQSVCAGGFSNG